MSRTLLKLTVTMGMMMGAVAACTSNVASEDGSTATSEDALSACAPSDDWWKTQYDDPSPGSCEGPTYYTNCGPASMAMLRYALTCGKSNKTAARMRSLVDSYTGINGCDGTFPENWDTVLSKANSNGTWFDDDKYPAMTTTNHCVASGANANYSATDLANDMANGKVLAAIVAGSAANGQKGPCGWNETNGHALFVAKWDGTYFTVYDPDSHKNSNGDFVRCGSSKPGNYKAKWTKTDLGQWANGFYKANSGQLCVLTGRRSCTPGDTTTSGCSTGFAKTCSSSFEWGSCLCVPGTTKTCVSPDCCGTCGHATQTCQADHTWTAGVCQNGC